MLCSFTGDTGDFNHSDNNRTGGWHGADEQLRRGDEENRVDISHCIRDTLAVLNPILGCHHHLRRWTSQEQTGPCEDLPYLLIGVPRAIPSVNDNRTSCRHGQHCINHSTSCLYPSQHILSPGHPKLLASNEKREYPPHSLM